MRIFTVNNLTGMPFAFLYYQIMIMKNYIRKKGRYMIDVTKKEKGSFRFRVKVSFNAMLMLIIFTFNSYAVTMPAYEILQPVTVNLSAPTSVALDKHECLFVAESVNNRVLVYSQSGKYINKIIGLSRPISVAVDNNMRAFIGNKDRGNVEAYDSSYNLLFKLGEGDGEFSHPNDIAINSTGKIYVVDRDEHKVKIYHPDGSYLSSFGSSGNGNGQFHKPTSIAIDETAGEVFVLDHQLTYDMFGKSIEGARIQVFDLDGSYKRGFSNYGNDIGEMFRPQHMTVDDQSRLYVTDSFLNVVLVYDNSGTHIGDVFDVGSPMRTPMGITVGSSNRLYTASLLTRKVEMFGIGTYTNMRVSPLSLSFQAQGGASIPASQDIVLSNDGTDILDWTAATYESWITLSQTTGTVQPSGTFSMNAGINLNGLSAGTYTGNISISAASGATEIVTVTLEVLSAPELSVIPASITFISTNGSNPPAQTLSVINSGAGTMNWTSAQDSSWISMDKTSGTAPESLLVSVDISLMNPGIHRGEVVLTGQGAAMSPTVIPVTLNITEITGTMNVSTNLPEATFTINGPQSYNGSGVNWIETAAAAGTYTIIYGDVYGYETPSSESNDLQENLTISFHGEYESQGDSQPSSGRNIIVGAGHGEQNAGTVKVFRADGTATGLEFTAHAYGYGVNVAAGDINNDGMDEMITAPGPGTDNPAEIRIYDRDGYELINLRTTANQYSYGANVASGDFNGDGKYEVLVGAGSGAGNPAEVKVYAYDQINNELADSGITLTAYTSFYGVRVAAGDINGDGIDEIITSPGPGQANPGVIKIWSVDSSSGIGQWDTDLIQEITESDRYSYSVTLGSGDVNGDGFDEIISGMGSDPSGVDDVRLYDSSGQMISEFRAYMTNTYGANVAGGDLDNDGIAEIIVTAGPGSGNASVVKIFNASGVQQGTFNAMSTLYGANVAVGDLGL